MKKTNIVIGIILIFLVSVTLKYASSNAESSQQDVVKDEVVAIKVAAQHLYTLLDSSSVLMDEPCGPTQKDIANQLSGQHGDMRVKTYSGSSSLPDIAPYTGEKHTAVDNQFRNDQLQAEYKTKAEWSDFSIQSVSNIYGGSDTIVAYCVSVCNSSGGRGYVIVGALNNLPLIMEYSLSNSHISASLPKGIRAYYVAPTIYATGTADNNAVDLRGCYYEKQDIETPSYYIVDGVRSTCIKSAEAIQFDESTGRVSINPESRSSIPKGKVVIRNEWNDVNEPSGNGYYRTADFASPPNGSVQPQVQYTNHCGPTSAMNLALYYLRKNVPASYPFTNDSKAMNGWTSGTWGTAIRYFGTMHTDLKNNQWLGSLPGTIAMNYAEGVRTYFRRQGATVTKSSRLSANDIDYKRIINDWRPVPLLNYIAGQHGYNWHWITGFGWREEVWRWSNSSAQYRDFYAKVNTAWDRASNTYVYCNTRGPDVPPGIQYSIGDYIIDFKVSGGGRYD